MKFSAPKRGDSRRRGAASGGAKEGSGSEASRSAGVAAAGAVEESIRVTGVAGLVAGAMSMAAGEYVSVSSKGDAEKADIARERHELKTQPDHELAGLTQIYEGRGLGRGLAAEVARELGRGSCRGRVCQ